MAQTLDELAGEDIIDSRDLAERLDELDEMFSADGMTDDEIAERNELRDLAEQITDFQYGETLIRDSYFVTYAQELAEDTGAIEDFAAWPATCIDWDHAARELQMDYTSAEINGITYWHR